MTQETPNAGATDFGQEIAEEAASKPAHCSGPKGLGRSTRALCSMDSGLLLDGTMARWAYHRTTYLLGVRAGGWRSMRCRGF